jgi:hypothetical protein
VTTSLGKLAIVRCILEAEKRSLLHRDRSGTQSPPLDLIKHTWFNRLGKLLFADIVNDNGELTNVFKNISFICFNYDRCIETFFEYALGYFRRTPEEVQELLRGLTIIHPYGRIRSSPVHKEPTGVPFGDVDQIANFDLTSQIRTFTERVEEETTLFSIKAEIKTASTIVFLGFAYHRLNMEILNVTDEVTSLKNIFGTAKEFFQF